MKTQRSKKKTNLQLLQMYSGRVRGENVGRERAELVPAVRTPCCVSLDEDRGLPESRTHLDTPGAPSIQDTSGARRIQAAFAHF